MCDPLGLLYASWVGDCYRVMDVSSWVNSLQDRLKVLHDVDMANASVASEKRLEVGNKNKSGRELVVGSKAFFRVHGLHGVLEASRKGPYDVTKIARVNYEVKRVGGSAVKIVHINNTKRYV